MNSVTKRWYHKLMLSGSTIFAITAASFIFILIETAGLDIFDSYKLIGVHTCEQPTLEAAIADEYLQCGEMSVYSEKINLIYSQSALTRDQMPAIVCKLYKTEYFKNIKWECEF